MLWLFCHFYAYIFGSSGRGTSESWTPWTSKVTSLMDHPQCSSFLQQPTFIAGWARGVFSQLWVPPFLYRPYRQIFTNAKQNKGKSTGPSLFLFWGGKQNNFATPSPLNVFPASPSLTPAEFYCGVHHGFIPVSLQTPVKCWVVPISPDFKLIQGHEYLYRGIKAF